MEDAHAATSEVVIKKLGSHQANGLTDAQVLKSREKYGRNELPPAASISFFRLILKQFEDLLVQILLGAAVVSFILACLEEGADRTTAFVEPAVILIILFANAAVGVIQETNAEAALEKLKESEARHARVVRNKKLQTCEAGELVPGDIIVIDVGDKIPADSRLISLATAALLVDEAMLTGESMPCNKHTDVIKVKNAVNQDKRNILFAGTLVVRGKAMAIVTCTGAKTEFGIIAMGLEHTEDEKTPLQNKLDEFGEQLSKVIMWICIIVWAMNVGHFTDPVHGSMIRGAIYYFKIAVALAVAAIPEGLPAVVTTCLALGTKKMAKHGAVVRRLPSVETLGCTTVICSDKTGTLTTNKMSVTKIMTVNNVGNGKSKKMDLNHYDVEGDSFAPYGKVTEITKGKGKNNVVALPAVEDPSLELISAISVLCNESNLMWVPPTDSKAGHFGITGAPTEAALKTLAEKLGVPEEDECKAIFGDDSKESRAVGVSEYWNSCYQRLHLLEFGRLRKSMSVLIEDVDTKDRYLYVKGAPESLLERCSHVIDSDEEEVELTAAMRKQILDEVDNYGEQGLRCLALAFSPDPPTDKKADYTNLDKYQDIETDLTFVGLVGMLDPPRMEVKGAIEKCITAGIRVIVITGDNKVTAESICRRIGVFNDTEKTQGKSFTGADWDSLNNKQRNDACKNASLFSRVEPRHKQEIVTILKNQGEIVAMTGDGVNDATALKTANIGIAMGSGTDVAREASDMVLQDDNFATIVMAVEEGRAIYANTKQFIRYLISSNIGEVACIFLTAIIGMPEALIPVQLLWVNLVTDGLPATALGFNPADKDIMQRKPRGAGDSIINGWMFFRYLAIGVYVGVGTVFGYIWWFLYSTNGPSITFAQLTNFHDCPVDTKGIYGRGFDCNMFTDARPSTISLSILVVVEMLNACNALSENQSLLVVTVFSNIWVVLACLLSLCLHFLVVYNPWLASIFHLAPLNAEEWWLVVYASVPVVFLDEILKFITRIMQSKELALRKKNN